MNYQRIEEVDGNLDAEYIKSIILLKLKNPSEESIVEFKHDNNNPKAIGEYISALSNTATLENSSQAFMVWGIDDATHKIIGTKFYPETDKIGNEELTSWLTRKMNGKVDFEFVGFELEGKHIVAMIVDRAFSQPIAFEGTEFIRVGTYKKCLKEFPEKERKLWSIFQKLTFEKEYALENIQTQDIRQLLDVDRYFELLKLPIPLDMDLIVQNLLDDNILRKESGILGITNLGAILLGKDLKKFPTIKRKMIRVIHYNGAGRISTIHEDLIPKGYATGFEVAIKSINGMLPRREVIGEVYRQEERLYLEIAIRELLANTLIHQDFSIRGTGPMIEIFDDRIEFSNPGTPLVKSERFLDTRPKSRNEDLASLMRNFELAEERGSDFDKVVRATEDFNLPAPVVRALPEDTVVLLYGPRGYMDMSKDERLDALYLHASLKYVENDFMSNASLRNRFKLEDSKGYLISRLIREGIDADLIRANDPNANNKNMKYVPFWA